MWTPSQCRTSVYIVSYNAWLSFNADTRLTQSRLEDFDAQRLGMKCISRQAHGTTPRRVWKDCKLPKADDTGRTVSTPVRDVVTLYQPTSGENEKED